MTHLLPANESTVYIVCEGSTDATLIGRLLIPPYRSEDVRIVSAGGASSAISLARTLLATKPSAVGLVLDDDAATHLGGPIEPALAAVAPDERWAVFVVEPNVHSLLASEVQVVESIVGRQLSDEEKRRYSLDVADFLQNLAKQQKKTYPSLLAEVMRRMNKHEVSKASVVKEILHFLDHNLQKHGLVCAHSK